MLFSFFVATERNVSESERDWDCLRHLAFSGQDLEGVSFLPQHLEDLAQKLFSFLHYRILDGSSITRNFR